MLWNETLLYPDAFSAHRLVMTRLKVLPVLWVTWNRSVLLIHVISTGVCCPSSPVCAAGRQNDCQHLWAQWHQMLGAPHSTYYLVLTLLVYQNDLIKRCVHIKEPASWGSVNLLNNSSQFNFCPVNFCFLGQTGAGRSLGLCFRLGDYAAVQEDQSETDAVCFLFLPHTQNNGLTHTHIETHRRAAHSVGVCPVTQVEVLAVLLLLRWDYTADMQWHYLPVSVSVWLCTSQHY